MPSTITDRLEGLTTSVAIKPACIVATTANITLSGEQTIDGVAVVSGDRVLVKEQTSNVDNGIYRATTSAWVRAADFDGSLDAIGGTQVAVISGTTNSNTYWRVDGTSTSIIIGTDAIVFEPAGLSDSGSHNFLPAGTGAVATTIQEVARRTVRAFDFYTAAQKAACLAGTDTDVSTALTAAITYAKTLLAPHFILDAGTHYAGNNTITFDLPNGFTLEFLGEIKSAAASKDAVVIGTAAANRAFGTAKGIKVRRSSNDTSIAPGSAGGSIGLRMVNLVDCKLDVRWVSGFSTGLLTIGDGYGFAYNEISMQAIVDSRTNVRLSQTNGGYNNENLYLGGHLNHNSGYAAVSTTNLLIDDGASGPLKLNNNVFLKPSFEDNKDPAGTVIAATINGEFNAIIDCRMENSIVQATYLIQITANATGCSVKGGFGVGDSNISDLGVASCFETSEGRVNKKQTPATGSMSVETAQSTSDSNARVRQTKDATGTVTAYETGLGKYYVTALHDFSGNRLLTTRKTGWTVATGTPTRTAFDTATVTLPQLAERVKALLDDLHSTAGHGIIGT